MGNDKTFGIGDWIYEVIDMSVSFGIVTEIVDRGYKGFFYNDWTETMFSDVIWHENAIELTSRESKFLQDEEHITKYWDLLFRYNHSEEDMVVLMSKYLEGAP